MKRGISVILGALLASFPMLVMAKSDVDTQAQQSAEIRALRAEVKQLRREVRRLERIVLNGQSLDDEDSRSNVWGCYLNDLNAGGIYGTGRTRAEAKGKTLEKCSKKEGLCFDHQIQCSQDTL
ncbi:hypothetical protein VST7929_01308 [Vibrio stylophorae]|uniref:Uncharacterized protein n=1 Tax=Vibrio stylophorae TaxID=659351 RepID=A0ABM8ZSZ7_9VIBR|nr:hypothetical protein [Vibrio stylophorae]CAH0533440.1 hypothetical protein VST7929_01308 [Vibrio stylophorae]